MLTHNTPEIIQLGLEYGDKIEEALLKFDWCLDVETYRRHYDVKNLLDKIDRAAVQEQIGQEPASVQSWLELWNRIQ